MIECEPFVDAMCDSSFMLPAAKLFPSYHVLLGGAAASIASARSIMRRPKVVFPRLKLASYNRIVRSFSMFFVFSRMQLVPFLDRRG
jgi:hypothetical protein